MLCSSQLASLHIACFVVVVVVVVYPDVGLCRFVLLEGVCTVFVQALEALCTVLMCTTMYHHIVSRHHGKFDCDGVRAWKLVIVLLPCCLGVCCY